MSNQAQFKYMKNRIVKDYTYWQIHKEEFNKEFWQLDESVRDRIKENAYCREAKLFEKKLETAVKERLGLTTV